MLQIVTSTILKDNRNKDRFCLSFTYKKLQPILVAKRLKLEYN